MKTKLTAYTGKFCWHEEWAIARLAKEVQEEITQLEKAMHDFEEAQVEVPGMADKEAVHELSVYARIKLT